MSLSLLLPTFCPGCSRLGPAPCRRCWARLEPAPRGPIPAGLDTVLAVLAYAGPGRELVARVKYRNARTVVSWLAAAMAALLVERPGVVTWAPTTPARRRERGFDHAEVLARTVARRIGGVPVVDLLERATGPPQTGRTARERKVGPAFQARPSPTSHLVVIDDVLTTGATLRSAALALRAASGSAERLVITGLVAARTPFRSTSSSDCSSRALATPRPSAG